MLKVFLAKLYLWVSFTLSPLSVPDQYSKAGRSLHVNVIMLARRAFQPECWKREVFLFLRKQQNLHKPKRSCWPDCAPGGSRAGTAGWRWHSKAAVRKVSITQRSDPADKGYYHTPAPISWPPVLPLTSFFHSKAMITEGLSTITYTSVSPWVPAQVSPWVSRDSQGPRQPVCVVGLDRCATRNLECPVPPELTLNKSSSNFHVDGAKAIFP